MNKIMITGRLTKDTELKTGGSGTEFCKFTVAVNRRKKDDPSDFFDCTAFGKTGVFVNTYFHKGDGIVVTGRMESSKTEKDGVKRTYWGVSVDDVEFPVGGGKAHEQNENDKAVAAATVVDDVEVPF